MELFAVYHLEKAGSPNRIGYAKLPSDGFKILERQAGDAGWLDVNLVSWTRIGRDFLQKAQCQSRLGLWTSMPRRADSAE